jgi:hypothetical protein
MQEEELVFERLPFAWALYGLYRGGIVDCEDWLNTGTYVDMLYVEGVGNIPLHHRPGVPTEVWSQATSKDLLSQGWRVRFRPGVPVPKWDLPEKSFFWALNRLLSGQADSIRVDFGWHPNMAVFIGERGEFTLRSRDVRVPIGTALLLRLPRPEILDGVEVDFALWRHLLSDPDKFWVCETA